MQQEKREQAEQEGNKAQREPAQKKKRRWSLLRLFFLLGLLAACFCWKGYHRKLTSKELDTALTRYMQGKYAIYGDTLTPEGTGKVTYLSSDIFYSTSNTYELVFSSEKFPKKWDREKIILDYNDKEKTLRDNYLSFVYRKNVEKKFREIFDQIYEPDSYELAMTTPLVPYTRDEQNAVETVKEYLQIIPWNYINVCVIRKPQKREDDMQKLLGILKRYGYDLNGRIYYVTQQQFDDDKRKKEWIGPRLFPCELYVNVCWNRGDDLYYIYSWEDNRGK